MQIASNLHDSSLKCDNQSKCRCCLALGKHQHTFGNAELEMLMENLNLFLLADPRLPTLICNVCAKTLSEVMRFRQLVLASETELRKEITDELSPDTQGLDNERLVIKTEISDNDNVGESGIYPAEMSIVKTEVDSDQDSSEDMISDADAGNELVDIEIKLEPDVEEPEVTLEESQELSAKDTQTSSSLKRKIAFEKHTPTKETTSTAKIKKNGNQNISTPLVQCRKSYGHLQIRKKAKRYCIAYGCVNTDVNTEGMDLSFFKLPLDIERCREWLTLLDREDLLTKDDFKPECYLVCSAHFQDFEYRRILKNDALPVKTTRNQADEGHYPTYKKLEKVETQIKTEDMTISQGQAEIVKQLEPTELASASQSILGKLLTRNLWTTVETGFMEISLPKDTPQSNLLNATPSRNQQLNSTEQLIIPSLNSIKVKDEFPSPVCKVDASNVLECSFEETLINNADPDNDERKRLPLLLDQEYDKIQTAEKNEEKYEEKTDSEKGVSLATITTGKRTYDKKHACMFCKMLVSKLPRHLEAKHKNEKEVVQFLSQPLNSKERHQMIEDIRQTGNYLHNSEAITSGKGIIIPKRRRKTDKGINNFTPCGYCHGLFDRRYASAHRKLCAQKHNIKNASKNAGKMSLPVADKDASKVLQEDVLAKMRNDDSYNVVITDSLILKFGSDLYTRLGKDEHVYIAQKMRQIAKFLITIRGFNKDINSLSDALNPEYYKDFVKAMRCLGKYCEERGRYGVPSLPLRLRTSIQQCAAIYKSELIINGQTDKRAQVEDFVTLIELNSSNEEIQGSKAHRSKRRKPGIVDGKKILEGESSPKIGDTCIMDVYGNENIMEKPEGFKKILEGDSSQNINEPHDSIDKNIIEEQEGFQEILEERLKEGKKPQDNENPDITQTESDNDEFNSNRIETVKQKGKNQNEKRHRRRKAWTGKEKDAMNRQMAVFWLRKKVPNKKECNDCLNREPDLGNRSWRDIKNYVHNIIKKNAK